MPRKIKLLSVVGARPQFVKLAPMIRATAKNGNFEHTIVHTGQHYDDAMSASFFEQLELPSPDLNLGIGSGTHGGQTAAMLTGLEQYLTRQSPDLVYTYGDTNSTLAITLAASKLHIRIAHIEAGLRSFDRGMPEEINRLVADHCSDRLYAPTPRAIHNLEMENLLDRVVLSGDVMLDAVLQNLDIADRNSQVIGALDLAGSTYGLVTVHRPVNTTRAALRRLLEALEKVTRKVRLVFPVHPRTQKLLGELDYKPPHGLTIISPLPYLDMLVVLRDAAVVITDSGGVQKEAAFLRTPCLTMRDESEWIETIEIGVNRLVNRSVSDLSECVSQTLGVQDMFSDDVIAKLKSTFGDGHAAERIVNDSLSWLQ